ncbi:hypothetical protein QO179_25125 [Bacillus stercoris]|nr:hypothetical protein [Bacillus stercoris]
MAFFKSISDFYDHDRNYALFLLNQNFDIPFDQVVKILKKRNYIDIQTSTSDALWNEKVARLFTERLGKKVTWIGVTFEDYTTLNRFAHFFDSNKDASVLLKRK